MPWRLPGLWDSSTTGLTFPDLNADGELTQTNLIMPEPTIFLDRKFPIASIIRPTETKGAAMGALFVGIERRLKAAVLVVGDGGLVSHFTGPEDLDFMAGLSCATRVAWFRAMAPIEPIRFIPHASPTPLLLQSGRSDNLVPPADAQALHTAAPEPRTIRWYDAGHGLTQQAAWDRHDWLQAWIGLDGRQ